MEDLDQRRLAIQKLQLVRQFTAQDREPCEVLPGLFIGRLAFCSPYSLSKNMLARPAAGGLSGASQMDLYVYGVGMRTGPIGAARNLDSLQKSGITHVLNASPVIPCFHKRHLRYKKILVYDDPGDDIARFFDESSRFIHKV